MNGPRSIFPSLSATCLLLGLALSACIHDDTSEIAVLSSVLPPAAPRIENTASRVPEQVAQNIGGIYEAPELERNIATIISKLRRASSQPHLHYSAVILNSPSVNAFALPSGQVFVTRGLLALANDEAELAAVIAHEMAHVEAQHTTQRMEQANNALLASRVVMSVLGDAEAAQASLVTSAMSLASFSRQQELKADEIGIRMAAQAGYDPHGGARFLENLERANALEKLRQTSKGDGSGFFASHPSGPQRVAAAIYNARQWGARGSGETGQEGYLRHLDGLIYGVDPSQGVVRGRRFIHSRLGFAFTAPEGFALENANDAVMGVARGERALRFDILDSGERNLEDVLQATAAEDLQIDKITPLKINGFRAVTALGHSPGWTFRIVLIEKEMAVYRFVFVSQSHDKATDAEFLAAAKSFKAIDAEDVALSRPLRLRITPVRNGDTPQSFAAAMAVQKSLEHFLVLNGIDNDAELPPGRLVKIISVQ